MKFVAAVRIRIEKDVVVRIHRNLRGKGQIVVKKDQEVTPSDIIGTSFVSSGFRTFNLADILSVKPQDVAKYLKKSLGQRVYQGELLAIKEGGFLRGKKIVTSPTDGVLDFLNPKTGEIRLTFFPKKWDLPAGVYGVVELVDGEKGLIIIRAQATSVYGVFGSGRIRDGILNVLGRRDQLLSKAMVSPKLDRQILVGGGLVFKEAISSAISAEVQGIITGGIDARDYKSMAGGRLVFPKMLENDVGLSIVVCEGFGSIPIGEDIYEILQKYNGKYVSVDGNKGKIYLPSFESISLNKVKSSRLPPLDSQIDQEQTNQLTDLKIGLKVRIIGNSYIGNIGKIVALDASETVLASKLKTFIATVETGRRKIQVPVANLEVIL